jgi:hypothetical protein
MSCAVWLAPKRRRRHRPPPVGPPRLPRGPTGVGTLRPKFEIAMSERLGAEGTGHAHLGGVLVGFSTHVCGNFCGN